MNQDFTTKLVNIIPAEKLPPDKNQIFSYLINQKINPGQEVLIPFHGRKVRGIIEQYSKQKIEDLKFKPKKIIEIIQGSFLTENQIKLAKWIADYYYTSLGQVIKLMLPSRIKQRVKEKTPQIKIESFPKLTTQQKKIFQAINQTSNNKPFLIHGVTGSGKTEIYLYLIQEQIKQNKQTIFLVPEISLTPQTIQRIAQRFGYDQISILHSRLTAGEKYTQWKKIQEQKTKIIIGPRSAIFAPVQNLGLIIIDEEHDSSYKQYDQKPRYHTRTIALKLSQLHNAKLVLGTATPDIQTYYYTEQKKCSLQKLPQRFTANQQMPEVKIIDMREEFKKKNFSIFSEILQKELNQVIKNNRQAILFINRRGASTFVMCRDCGFVLKCPNCDIPLTYHIQPQHNYPITQLQNYLRCHHCNYFSSPPINCPNCKSLAIKFFGTGTQKVQTELQKLYKYVKIFRMDSDTTRTKNAHSQIYNDFRLKKANILIGTQMITKGWDLPEIDLIGVISTDVGLNMPDFRAQERTFQLLTQVAGRTGRGHNQGKVIFQTYSPENFVIRTAASHDFETFYKHEIQQRKKLKYPPFCRLIKLIYKNHDLDQAQREAQALAKKINTLISLSAEAQKAKTDKYPNIQLLGPAPSFFSKIRGNYIWHIILKLKNLKQKKDILKLIPNDWVIDIDPESLL